MKRCGKLLPTGRKCTRNRGHRVPCMPGVPATIAPPPSYSELADLVAELTAANIANLDADNAGYRFVSCFTYRTSYIPPHWQRAIDAREALIANGVVERKGRS